MSRLGAAPRSWRLLRQAGDSAVAVGAFYAAFLCRIHLPLPLTRFVLPAERIRFFFSEWWVILASQLLILYFFGFYDAPMGSDGPQRWRRLAAATATQVLGLAGYFFLADREFPRSVLLLFVAFNYLALGAWRALLERTYRPPARRVAIVGSGRAAGEVAEKIARSRHGLVLAGWLPAPDEAAGDAPEARLGPRLGTLDDLPRLLAEHRVDDVILAPSSRSWQSRLLDRLAGSQPLGSNLLLLPGPLESLIGRMRYRWVEDLPLIEVVRQSEWHIEWPIKRLIDLVAGSLLVILALPLMAACTAAIAASSPGPILLRQTRVGRDRREFTLWKFRTMRADAERETGEVLAAPGDPRLTPFGAALRSLRLDELPQLFNVLGGSMSLVGPRPERPGFVARYLREVPGYAERFSVAPGLTGLAQVNGDYHSSAENKLRYDLAYIANWSPWLDLAILLRTVKTVLTSRGV